MTTLIMISLIALTFFLTRYYYIRKLKKSSIIDLEHRLNTAETNISYYKDQYEYVLKNYDTLLKSLKDKKGIVNIDYTIKISDYGQDFEKTLNFTFEILELERTGSMSKIELIGRYNDIKSYQTNSSAIKERVYYQFNNTWIETDKIDFYEQKEIIE